MTLIAYAGRDASERRGPGRPKGPIKTACPILRELFRIAEVKGYNQAQIAAGIDKQKSEVNEYRCGRTTPNIFVYHELAKFLGVEIRIFGSKR